MMATQRKAPQSSVKVALAAKKAAASKRGAAIPSLASRVTAAFTRAAPADRLVLHYRTVATPLGPFSLYVDEAGAVRCCHWQLCPPGDEAALAKEQADVCAALQSRWYKDTAVTMAQEVASAETRAGDLATRLLEAYFNPPTVEAGRPAELEKALLQVPIVYPPTTAFMITAWEVLRRTVPSGETISYKGLGVRVSRELAEKAAAATTTTRAQPAPRAIGAAMGANPIPIIVPCHRVLSSSHSMRGYGLGLRYKVWLLRHEQADVPLDKLRAVEEETAISTAVSRR